MASSPESVYFRHRGFVFSTNFFWKNDSAPVHNHIYYKSQVLCNIRCQVQLYPAIKNCWPGIASLEKWNLTFHPQEDGLKRKISTRCRPLNHIDAFHGRRVKIIPEGVKR
ncbi:Hypothetical predicted protein [Cloeon dipterum]|uniref:Uncharacterized protein n=1 Tax=Cloeon dipterum TaxID=197152 RepID=A0A8S1E544_9INSE|nr:Hypothetical predicted protein [Cloeon dipterum]